MKLGMWLSQADCRPVIQVLQGWARTPILRTGQGAFLVFVNPSLPAVQSFSGFGLRVPASRGSALGAKIGTGAKVIATGGAQIVFDASPHAPLRAQELRQYVKRERAQWRCR